MGVRIACEVCQSMNGVIYDSANDIPDRPHPNCKCHIEIIEKESEEAVSDLLKDYTKRRNILSFITFSFIYEPENFTHLNKLFDRFLEDSSF